MKLFVELSYIFNLFVLISGCATDRSLILPREERVNLPPLNELQQAEVEDTIISEGKFALTMDSI